MTSRHTPQHTSPVVSEIYIPIMGQEEGKTKSRPIHPLTTGCIAEQLAKYDTPPSSPLNLPLLSTPVRGLVTRVIDQEARRVSSPHHPPFPPDDDPDDGDVSYPSLVNVSSEWSLNFLNRHPRAPPNTCEMFSSSPPQPRSQVQHSTAHSSPCPLPRTNYRGPPAAIDDLGVFDPLPLPEYAKVRKWLKMQWSSLDQPSYARSSPNLTFLREHQAPSTMPSSPSEICATPPFTQSHCSYGLAARVKEDFDPSPTLEDNEEEGEIQPPPAFLQLSAWSAEDDYSSP
ncbi:hypothetical protein DB88DRAFT_548321 [Papiliotrema laurentii]|uniref:Uncharacterized protein n=1 Tax=Papiliotrema laurentii TaxID=5418 RepID=A0AAD9CS39_PAPLA|nr:hypothetical protein DB88DRAFT_548321 [Papiliotrema laurentii]